jgi:hypothetical protein
LKSTFVHSPHRQIICYEASGQSALEEDLPSSISAKLTMTRQGSLFCAKALTPEEQEKEEAIRLLAKRFAL